jgi:hypothetical protein
VVSWNLLKPGNTALLWEINFPIVSLFYITDRSLDKKFVSVTCAVVGNACFAISDSGELFSWGDNSFGLVSTLQRRSETLYQCPLYGSPTSALFEGVLLQIKQMYGDHTMDTDTISPIQSLTFQ